MIDLSKYHVVNCFGTPLEKYPFADEIQFCLSHIRSGETVIDVGANAAYYSLPFSDAVGAAGRVEAFEPSAKYREFFARNMGQCAVVNAGNWALHPLAVGRDCGATRLVHSGQTGSTTGLYTAGADENSPDPKINSALENALHHGGVYIYGTGGAANALVESLSTIMEYKNVIGFVDTFKNNDSFRSRKVINVNKLPIPLQSKILLTGVFRWQMQAELDKRGIKNYMHIATPGEIVTVPQTTIDGYMKIIHCEKVHFLKVDTDGGEADVLEGAKSTLLLDHPKIFCEVNILHDAARRIFDVLTAKAYEIWSWPENQHVTEAQQLDDMTKERWARNSADGMNIFAEVR